MTENPNAALIDAVQRHLPPDANAAQTVADTLFVSREAAYRRLRAEVPFSFGEAARLGDRLGFSLDETAYEGMGGMATFRLRFDDSSPAERYEAMLERNCAFFSRLASDPDVVFASAGNRIFSEMSLRYETLAAFQFYQWLYRCRRTGSGAQTFEQFHLPPSLATRYRRYVAGVRQVASTRLVVDDSLVERWISAVRAFEAMHLVDRKSVRRIGDELLQLLDEWERIAEEGEYPNGNRVELYLSDIDLEATCSYIETPARRFAGIGIFSVNALWTADPAMFEDVKRWIGMQCRFSTQIARCGTLQRIRFFRRQRALIAELE